MKPRHFVLCLLAVFYQSEAQIGGTNLILELPRTTSQDERVALVAPRWLDGNQIYAITSSGRAEWTPSPRNNSNLVSSGAWSQPVSDAHGNSLRGRLLIYKTPLTSTNALNQREQYIVPVCLEIQDVKKSNKVPTKIYFDVERGLHFEVCYADGAPAYGLKAPDGFSSRAERRPFWATLPAGGLLRLYANEGLGISLGGENDLRLAFLDRGIWIIPAGDNIPYYLHATLSLPPTNSTPYSSNIWQGLLELPAAKLPAANHSGELR